jgi:SAM-dependent methyltransferase
VESVEQKDQASPLEKLYPEFRAGGFTRVDGTVQFYTRIQSLLPDSGVILDLGAGRGALADTPSEFRRKLVTLGGPNRRVVGLDVDEAVLHNPLLDEAKVYDGGPMPLADASIDLIVSDHVLEHVDDPRLFAAEIARILKPGGWFCARTPHALSLMVAASSLVPNRHHGRVLGAVQPDRPEVDIFPTRYRLNTARALARYFSREEWRHFSYTYSPEPAYFFNNAFVHRLLQLYQYLKFPVLGGEVLMVFLQRK